MNMDRFLNSKWKFGLAEDTVGCFLLLLKEENVFLKSLEFGEEGQSQQGVL